jgi:hypothetical protein
MCCCISEEILDEYEKLYDEFEYFNFIEILKITWIIIIFKITCHYKVVFIKEKNEEVPELEKLVVDLTKEEEEKKDIEKQKKKDLTILEKAEILQKEYQNKLIKREKRKTDDKEEYQERVFNSQIVVLEKIRKMNIIKTTRFIWFFLARTTYKTLCCDDS